MDSTIVSTSSSPRNSQGWDGKLRVVKTDNAPHNSDAPSPPQSENEGEDEEAEEVERKYEIVEGEEIKADEGTHTTSIWVALSPTAILTDLLQDVDPDETVDLLTLERRGRIADYVVGHRP